MVLIYHDYSDSVGLKGVNFLVGVTNKISKRSIIQVSNEQTLG